MHPSCTGKAETGRTAVAVRGQLHSVLSYYRLVPEVEFMLTG